MALKGLKVIEIAGLAPAPFCGMILADFGATVIRIDRLRGNNLDCLANGKKSLALDLKTQKGAEVLRRLCKTSDVLLEPFRKGVMERLGLGPNVLLADNPRLIYARLTGYGQTGDLSMRAGHDINYVSISGLLSLLGRKHENPTPPINLAADFGGGGLTCALGIVMALLERSSSGKGQVIDANMVEGAAYLSSWIFRSQQLPVWGNKRGENLLDSGAHFYDTYKTKDGKYMAVGALEPQFYDLLLEGLGMTDDDLPQMGNFDTNRQILTKKFLEKTRDEWCKVFDDVDACVTPVLSLEEVKSYKHNRERQSFVMGADGVTVAPAPAPRMSRTPGVSKAPLASPHPGQDTRDILSELNYTKEEIDLLEKDNIVRTNTEQQSKL